MLVVSSMLVGGDVFGTGTTTDLFKPDGKMPCNIDELYMPTLLPTLFGQDESLPREICQIAKLTPSQRGLGMPDLQFEAPLQFASSSRITSAHSESINSQNNSWRMMRAPQRWLEDKTEPLERRK